MDKQSFQRFPSGQSLAHSGFSGQNYCEMRSGAFARPPLPPPPYDSSGAQQGTPVIPGGFWSGQGVHQQAPPPLQTAVNSQVFNYGPRDWPGVAPPMGPVTGGYRPPYPQQQSFVRGHPNTMVPNFDPTRPPPPLYESQLEQFSLRHDNPEVAAEECKSRQEFNYMLHEEPVKPWEHGSDGRSQNRLGAPHFNRHFEERRSYPDSGPGGNELHYQRQKNPDYVFSERVHRSSADIQPYDRWQQDHQLGQDGHSREIQSQPTDEETRQRRADEQWLVTFLLNRKTAKSAPSKRHDSNTSVCQVRETLYSAARLVSELSIACQTLKENIENEHVWTESYAKAVAMKCDIQEKLKVFSDPSYIERIKKKLAFISKKRLRNRRKKRERLEEKEEQDAWAAEREAAIDKWRMERIHEVEEKKREQELKVAADSVLSEVRKKQADTKRMLDILRSLEKLRKLRKEAAARKGIFPEKEADEAFEGHVERLRKLIRKRTGVCAAEEKALRVMLEGEREEERKREQERRQKKERERLLQKKREAEAMLFGEEMHPDHPLQPFKQFYTQAEHSLHALIQIRREWDSYLVPADHPDGSSIPQGWVLPEAPSDEAWASALDKQEPATD
ncbi:hypothetical protein MATL_G00139560 [Megalops atlanticus]|uniref:Programmed cell death 7 n=1 Tax=Megalops atlanticus TaxID=7932 RepID=A0A9D3T9D7_MEGAT|nr:hypothetical protein MATL_G00139560 [Megalops atlanticus]